jgi:hypothetical protein
MLVHNAKLKIQEEYARKEKEREINKRMYVIHIHVLTAQHHGGLDVSTSPR